MDASDVKKMPIDDVIRRINELAHKSKSEGLTPAEQDERTLLRNRYRESVLGNLRSQLDTMSIKEPDGTIRKVVRSDGKDNGRK